MNPRYYLWLTDALQLLAMFVVGPIVGIVIAYKAWRGQSENLSRYRNPCLASTLSAAVLLVFAAWLNADVKTFQYFVQVACIVLGGLSLWVASGCGVAILLRTWYWHKETRLH